MSPSYKLKTKSIIITSLIKHHYAESRLDQRQKINTQHDNIYVKGRRLRPRTALENKRQWLAQSNTILTGGTKRFFVSYPVERLFFNIALSRKAACEAAPHGRACLHKPEGTLLEGFVPNPSTLPAGLFVPATSRLEGWRADSCPPPGPRPSHANTRHLVAITELQPGRHPEGHAKAWRLPISARWTRGRPGARSALHYRRRRTVYISPMRDWGGRRGCQDFSHLLFGSEIQILSVCSSARVPRTLGGVGQRQVEIAIAIGAMSRISSRCGTPNVQRGHFSELLLIKDAAILNKQRGLGWRWLHAAIGRPPSPAQRRTLFLCRFIYIWGKTFSASSFQRLR